MPGAPRPRIPDSPQLRQMDLATILAQALLRLLARPHSHVLPGPELSSSRLDCPAMEDSDRPARHEPPGAGGEPCS